MPRVRRPRRQAPVLELLEATLPELRRGLTERAARTVAYELFEKLGYGAVAVTDTHAVLAFVGAGADHHAAGDQPIRPVYEAIARGGPLLAPLGLRTECGHPACPLGAAAVVPLRFDDGPAGALVAFATAGSPLDETAVDTLEALGTQLSAQLQLSQLATATTTALQAQMEPHFVFNALNTIAAFIRTEPERARKLVLAFADHLRSRLARPGEFITLEEELRHVRSYLELEQARFGSELQVTVDAAPDALAVRLPPLLVQPLVENAIKHGKTERPLNLLVRARVRRGTLRVTVRDDGRGIARDVIDRVLEQGVGDGSSTGLGLANVNARLNAHYGENVRLRSFPFGTVVRLSVPVSIRVLLVDDEAPARSELRYLLASHEDVQVVGEAASAGEALGLADGVAYDVVFLDVEMPGLTGVQAAPLVRDRPNPPAVVFVTAHEHYAVEAFAVEAFDYLLKPVDPDRLARVIERLRERSSESAAPLELEKIPVVAGSGTELLDFDQIHYVQADGDYSRVHTYDRSYLCTASLGELEERLGSRFARIHRSYVVNLGKVAGVRRAAPDRFRLQLADAEKTELDVARRQSRQLRERLGL